ncbi:ribonuclease E activity regulator RraA [Actinomycetospora sp. OC33-EN08]|uniref:4-hydroxy-4-methyl-2-oxoglutarate aldolase n=1 Tax=Actinomycetospora aurantiaca TaxID=3129233 RepID=A0ABU8MN12_9PSEU
MTAPFTTTPAVSTFRPAVRPAAVTRLISEIAELSTADASDRFGAQARVLDLPLRQFGGRRSFYGPVRTVRCHRDNELVRQLLGEPGMGSVLVVDGGGSTRSALLGDRIADSAVRHGWSGVVVHGAVRDAAVLEATELGVAALTTHPERSSKSGRGEVDVSLALGGAAINPGDVVLADLDGVLVIDPWRVEANHF